MKKQVEKKYFGKLPNTSIYRIDDSEKLAEIIKPNKFKYLFPFALLHSLLAIIFGGGFITVGILGMLKILFAEETYYFTLGALIFSVGVFIVAVCAIRIVFRLFRYLNLEYIISSKRIIVSYGIRENKINILNLEFIVDIIPNANFFDRSGKIKTASLVLKGRRIDKNDQLVFTLKHIENAKKVQETIQNLINVLELEKIEKEKENNNM